MHGFLQTSFKHAIRLGQSASTTFRLWLRNWKTASVVRITLVPFKTLTPCSVTSHNTIGIDCTIARINTFFVSASKNLRTFFIYYTICSMVINSTDCCGCTLLRFALYVRITLQPRWTATYASIIRRSSKGI